MSLRQNLRLANVPIIKTLYSSFYIFTMLRFISLYIFIIYHIYDYYKDVMLFYSNELAQRRNIGLISTDKPTSVHKDRIIINTYNLTDCRSYSNFLRSLNSAPMLYNNFE